MKIWCDLAFFFAAKQLQLLLNLNRLFINSLFFFRNEFAKLVAEREFLVAKVEVLVALRTALLTISSPGLR